MSKLHQKKTSDTTIQKSFMSPPQLDAERTMFSVLRPSARACDLQVCEHRIL